jgi:hypothetical protein
MTHSVCANKLCTASGMKLTGRMPSRCRSCRRRPPRPHSTPAPPAAAPCQPTRGSISPTASGSALYDHTAKSRSGARHLKSTRADASRRMTRSMPESTTALRAGGHAMPLSSVRPDSPAQLSTPRQSDGPSPLPLPSWSGPAGEISSADRNFKSGIFRGGGIPEAQAAEACESGE